VFTKHRFRAGGGAVFINAVGGQNSIWTALFGGGLVGLLIYKPQLGLLIPVAFGGAAMARLRGCRRSS
jgi:hypothetical protein